jgi:hypothetical protein
MTPVIVIAPARYDRKTRGSDDNPGICGRDRCDTRKSDRGSANQKKRSH